MIHQIHIPANANNATIYTNKIGNRKVTIKNVYFIKASAADVAAGDFLDDEVAILQSNIFNNVHDNKILVGVNDNNFKEVEFITNVPNNINFTVLSSNYADIVNFQGCIITLDIEH
jgi:hypothetical protein